MWQFISLRIGSTDLLHLCTAPHYETFQVFLIYFPKCPKFQYHTKLCSKCSTLLIYSLNLNPVCWWNESSSCWVLLLAWKSWFQFHMYIWYLLLLSYLSHATGILVIIRHRYTGKFRLGSDHKCLEGEYKYCSTLSLTSASLTCRGSIKELCFCKEPGVLYWLLTCVCYLCCICKELYVPPRRVYSVVLTGRETWQFAVDGVNAL